MENENLNQEQLEETVSEAIEEPTLLEEPETAEATEEAAAQQPAVFREAAALYRISAEVAAVLYVFKRHMSEAFHSQSSS